ncbi:MAG TPA: adenylate/guanylate cyclase domain-containing protein [Vicinamibacterales bacterium]|jgi:class 3 adenylate cyclase
MVSALLGSFVLVSIAATAALTVYLVAVLRRWFAAMPHGFLVALVSAFVGIGVFAVWLSGAWGYQAAYRIIFSQVVLDLKNVGDIVERQIQAELDEALLQLTHLASEVAADQLQKLPTAEIERNLREVAHIDTRFVQLTMVDAQGKRLGTFGTVNGSAPLPRIGVAYCLEGKTFASDPYVSSDSQRSGHSDHEHVMDLCVPITLNNAVVGGIVAQFDIQDNLVDLLSSATFNQSGRATLVGSDGHVLADPKAERLNADLSQSEAVRAGLGGASGSITSKAAGEQQFVFYRPVRNPATINPKPWALLTGINAAEAVAPLDALATQILLGILGLMAVSLLAAWAISWSITRPVAGLVEFARRVQGGDLTTQAQVLGRDVHGQLSEALNAMVKGLRERDRVKEVFGRYVTTQVSEQALKGELNLGGERRRVTILFSDIRNFTTMSEQLTPEETVSFLNNYFSEMVDAVFEYGGMLDKFLGDGLMAVFGATDDRANHAEQAVRAALRMKSLLAKINGERAMRGLPATAIGVGIHTDVVIVGNIGSARRLEYTVIGDGVNTASRLESMNKELGTTILISDGTHQDVQDLFVCRPMQEVHLKGKAKALTAYEVVSMVGTVVGV